KRCVVNSMKKQDANLLFYLAVQQYNQSPTKSKAITINDLFLGPQAFWKQQDWRGGAPAISIGELDTTGNLEHIGTLAVANAQVVWYKDRRKEANSMNAITRFFTSNSRRATPGIFDNVVQKAKLDPTLVGSALFGLIANADGQDPAGQTGWEQEASFGKTHLAKAGFDVSALGLDDIAQAQL
ncbi:MAG: hypothetical protein ACREP9_17155, partial [Candidatus Dormibacteraceae bacterium]